MKEHIRDLFKCFKRLEKSDTPLKRKNARAELWKKLSEIKNDAGEMYPLLEENGEAKQGIKGPPPCPFCGIPINKWSSWLRHLQAKHNLKGGECYCGKRFKRLFSHFKGLRAHGQDIKEHVTKGILVQGIPEDPNKMNMYRFNLGKSHLHDKPSEQFNVRVKKVHF